MAIRSVEEVLDTLGIARSACTGSLRVQGSTACLSSKPGRNSLARAHRVQVDSLEKLESLVGHASAKATAPKDVADDADLRQTLLAYVLGGARKNLSRHAGALAERYLPLAVIVYTGDEIVIRKGEVLDIEPDGHDPVVVNYRVVKLEEGGQIRCHAPVLMTLEKFIKKKSLDGE